jgi:hypothetical protein
MSLFKKSLMAILLLSFIICGLTFANSNQIKAKYNRGTINYTGYTQLVPSVNVVGWYNLMNGDIKLYTFYWDGTYVYTVDDGIASEVVVAHE